MQDEKTTATRAGREQGINEVCDRADHAIKKLHLVSNLLCFPSTSDISNEALDGAFFVMNDAIDDIREALDRLWDHYKSTSD